MRWDNEDGIDEETIKARRLILAVMDCAKDDGVSAMVMFQEVDKWLRIAKHILDKHHPGVTDKIQKKNEENLILWMEVIER